MKKVTLRELVADKIVFAALITLYYWMWARNDWKDSYQTIQYVIFVFTFFYFVFRASRLKKYKQETIDEMAELLPDGAAAGALRHSDCPFLPDGCKGDIIWHFIPN